MEQFRMEIQFDRYPPIYKAGEKLTGIIILVIENRKISTAVRLSFTAESGQKMAELGSSKISANGLSVSVTGEAHNSWVSKNSDKIYESSEVYLDHSLTLMDKCNDYGPDRHEFPFAFNLPDNLPSSYESEYGQIRYIVQAICSYDPQNQTSPTDSHIERQFGVVARLNLSDYPSTQQPVEAIDATDLTCCCIPLGSVRAVLIIPKNGYAANEAIPISVTIFNGTPKKIKRATFKLIQRARFVASSRYENAQDTKEKQYCVATVNKGTIQPRKFLRLDKESISVPFLVPTYYGSIISISYILCFQADPGVEIAIPIVIGSTE